MPSELPSIAAAAPRNREDTRVPESRAVRLAFLLSRYPGISHTFFLHEIRGLRKLGLTIVTASINEPDRPWQQLTPSEQEEARATYYIKPVPWVRATAQLLGIALRSPRMVWRALRASQSMGPASPGRRLFALFYVGEALLLCRWMREQRATHLHAHFGGAVATVALIAAAAARLPYSLTIHGPDEFFDEQHFQLKAKLERAAFVIAISNFCRSQLMRIASPEAWPRFDVVRLGIRPELLPPARARTASASPVVRLVMVGRLVPAKGPMLLLEAFRRARATFPSLMLSLVGDGPERPKMERFLDEHGLRDVVTLAGALNHDRTLAKVAAADVFVLASFAEGIPVALMEAMALGVPCISTLVAGIPELIVPGRDGILVPAGSIEALTDAILALARDPELRERLGSSGRKQVLQEYRLETNLQILADNWKRRLSAEETR